MTRAEILAALAALPAHERHEIVTEAMEDAHELDMEMDQFDAMEAYAARTYSAREDLSECRNWEGEI